VSAPTWLEPADVLLSDGKLGVIRGLAPGDGPALHELHSGVSDDALRFRFFSLARKTAHDYVEHVLGDPTTLALVAEAEGRLVALATAEPLRDGVSEVAFLVADDFRGHGIGTLLLEHLAAMARDQGIARFEADVLPENHGMLSVFEDAGFEAVRRLDTGVVLVEMSTAVTAEQQAAADDHECRAESRSLRPMLSPRSVAVVGVRRDGTGIGAAVLRSIRAGGYLGALAVIHPSADEIDGVPAFRSAADVPAGVDLVVIAVPAGAAVAALSDAADAAVPAAVVISSGFEELGDEGAAMQQELSTVARTRGIRVVGPNCLGLVANDPLIRLNATFNEALPPSGGLAVASQSGGVGIVLMDLARELGLGVGSFVSLGNKADVSSNDLLAAWYDDPSVSAAALYLESFGNARKFARMARRFSERKPLLAVVGGRSAGGQRAGASHTAAAASPAVGVRALFAQSGVIGCADAEDLAQTALLLTEQPLPRGRRIAIISNAGGMGVLGADLAEDLDLQVPEFSSGLRARIAGFVHGTTGTGNPVDAGAGAAPEQLAGILEEVMSSDEVDAVVAVLVATGVTDGVAVVDALAEVRARHADVPVLLVPLGGMHLAPDARLTTYRSTAAAVRSLAHAVGYAEWLAVPRVWPPTSDAGDVRLVRDRAQELLVNPTDPDGWLSQSQAPAILDPYGISVAGVTVNGSDAAVEAASRCGFPVVLKVAGADVVHKTERRLVRVGLDDAAAVRQAMADFREELGYEGDVLVQPLASGVELAIGVVRDPGLGPLVMVAAGGVATDIWDDRVFLVPPISSTDAARAVHGLRLSPLLEGFRGAPVVDTTELERLIVDIGRLAVDVPEVAELDLNPVIVGPTRSSVVDVKLRLSPLDGSLDGPRQLRRVR
jgi:acyl-CoA synthetase (NDP forming)/GNAT superfamily N-acetyltransferase